MAKMELASEILSDLMDEGSRFTREDAIDTASKYFENPVDEADRIISWGLYSRIFTYDEKQNNYQFTREFVSESLEKEEKQKK